MRRRRHVVRISLVHPKFTFVSDFDGVWTNPKKELESVHNTVKSRLLDISGWSKSKLEEIYASFSEKVFDKPKCYGWRIEGRFSSFVDEDYFAVPTSIAQYIDDAPCDDAKYLKKLILKDFDSVLAFVDTCYFSSCESFRDEVSHDLVDGSESVLRWLISNNVQVVFATNAPYEKVRDWLGEYGLEVADARNDDFKSSPIRVYGRAGKQHLAPDSTTLTFCDRSVFCDRPEYLSILAQESPDFVLGDVLSLDLSQPIAMRVNCHSSAPFAVGIMDLPHTPDWVLESVGEGLDKIDYLVPHITSLPRIIQEIRTKQYDYGTVS